MRAVILAGGKGTRLAPYTTVFPKPLMPVSEMPILEIVLRQLRASGIDRVTICVGYLSELLETFFGNGEKFDLKIDYSKEDHPLGTAGPLTLIDDLDETFLMMNGDILTDMDFNKLIQYHIDNAGVATIATKNRTVDIDFGVIESTSDNVLTGYIEKPSFNYHVSMGVYVFEPSVMQHIKKGAYTDFPDVIKTLIADGKRVMSYPFQGYWLDIGRHDDFAVANEVFENNKKQFLRK